MTQTDCILLPRVQFDHLLSIAMANDELLTTKQAAKYLQCSIVTFWKIRKVANIQSVLVGKKLFFRKEDLDKYLKREVCHV
jgi:excisionase family DNA binding protein